MADLMPYAPTLSRRLPVQPAIAAAVLQRISRGETPDLTALVEIDPALTAAVLHAANAPHRTQMRRVATARHAMVLLGATAVQAIAASGTAALVLGADDAGCPSGYWTRAVSTAAACAVLARILGTNEDEAFTVGMIHDIGDLVLYRRDQMLHQLVIDRAIAGGRLVDHEANVHGRSHVELGTALMEQWLLPERLITAVKLHHGAPEALFEPLAKVLWAGVQFGGAAVGGATAVPQSPDALSLDAVLQILQLGHQRVKVILGDVQAEIAAVTTAAGLTMGPL